MNEEILPQVEQVPPGAQVDQIRTVGGDNEVHVVPPDITNKEIRDPLVTLAEH